MLLTSLGSIEIVLILVVLAMIWALGRYGRDTRIGFGGAVLLGALLTPLVAFIIISFLKPKRLRRLQGVR